MRSLIKVFLFSSLFIIVTLSGISIYSGQLNRNSVQASSGKCTAQESAATFDKIGTDEDSGCKTVYYESNRVSDLTLVMILSLSLIGVGMAARNRLPVDCRSTAKDPI